MEPEFMNPHTSYAAAFPLEPTAPTTQADELKQGLLSSQPDAVTMVFQSEDVEDYNGQQQQQQQQQQSRLPFLVAGSNKNENIHDQQQQQQQQQYHFPPTGGPSTTTASSSPVYRDAWAAILFVASQVFVLFAALAWGIPALHKHLFDTDDTNSSSSSETNDPMITGLFRLTIICGLVSLVLISGAMSILVKVATQLIQMSLLLTVVVNGLTTLLLIAKGWYWTSGIGIVSVMVSLWYYRSIRHRIPFAAANLTTALSAIQCNGGLVLLGFAMTALLHVGSVLWFLACLGAFVQSADCTNSNSTNQSDCTESQWSPAVLMAMLFLYYWMVAVYKNVLTCTVAGVVGTFWFVPDEASTFCSPAIADSFRRSTTSSFGSICLGSLVTAILQLLHHAAQQARHQGRSGRYANCGGLLFCVLECFSHCLEQLVTYFNRWAYGTYFVDGSGY
jgi:hypothetical protein